jgi:hypothetical protein
MKLVMAVRIARSDKATFICPFLHIDEYYPHVIESARHEPDR